MASSNSQNNQVRRVQQKATVAQEKRNPARIFLIVFTCIVLIVSVMWTMGIAFTGDPNPVNWISAAQTRDTAPSNEENDLNAHIPSGVCALSKTDEGISPFAIGGGFGEGTKVACPGCGLFTATQFITQATCTKGGTMSTSCSSCGYSNTSTDSPLGHRDFTWAVTEAPTADSTGVASYTCGHCDYVKKTAAVYALPEDPVKEGYHFVGWYYDEEFTEPYDGEPVFADTDLYAKFEINIVTVTFNSDGGTEIDEITAEWNTTITTTVPEKTGYNFLGWFKSNGKQFDDSELITENMTLTARWQIKTFTVTFYVEGELYTSVTVDYGSVLSKLADELSLYIMTMSSETGEPVDGIVVCNTNVVAAEMTGLDKALNTIKNNKWLIVGVAVSCIALIAVIVAACGGKKRKEK